MRWDMEEFSNEVNGTYGVGLEQKNIQRVGSFTDTSDVRWEMDLI